MNLLVLGGSYFLGKHFVSIASKEHNVTVINRGNKPLHIEGVKEYQCDRHYEEDIQSLPSETYDVCIDFCAYRKGDIQYFLDNFPGNIKHYIFISTVDVLERYTNTLLSEESKLEERIYEGDIGTYIHGKVELEKEIQAYDIAYTIVRPGNIYGPGNYAYREKLYIERIKQGLPLYNINEADGHFQLVYVLDVAKAILLLCGEHHHEIYHILNMDPINIVSFNRSISDHIVDVSLQKAIEDNYPLVYPFFKPQQELYIGTRFIEEFNYAYTSLEEGMKETINFFMKANK